METDVVKVIDMKNQKKVVVVTGPTASGKTATAVFLAKKFKGEIVSADSRQVYRGLDIGTGKDLDEYQGIPYHLIDICKPGEDFNLFKFIELANKKIAGIIERGNLPIVVGGTGLYIQGLMMGFALEKNGSKKSKIHTRAELAALSLLELNKIYRDYGGEGDRKSVV